MKKITICENGQGRFQVWDGNNVLRPETLNWEGAHQANHDWMFFMSEKAAVKAAKESVKKYTIVKEKEIFLQ